MGMENNRLAADISDLIDKGEFNSRQLSLIEVACRKERSRIGPHGRFGTEPEGRKHKRLRRRTPEDVSAELAERFGKAAPDEKLDVNVPAQASSGYCLTTLDRRPNVANIEHNGKYYYTHELKREFVNKIFVTTMIPRLSRLQCRVSKVNRTRAVIEVEGHARDYTIPLRIIIAIYLNGEFL
ncbi:hypothetical protein BH789_gp063 [Gordonia phage GMA6]|uniref:Uncharacterized protein n=1 Tax=Gordonia phage GMA6 TaxID=1647285 RepID=A0A0K0NL70_9CAUD|nr:hypothetical protein BH789_gp063 [Gordonia phage GMA6]AKL88344.1 hypothetical protein GMA6_63 [Gordonia phage GMA6]